MISDDRANKALIYLAETDEEAAILFAAMESWQDSADQAWDEAFLAAKASTVAEREAIAGTNHNYGACLLEKNKATKSWKAVANKRSTEELVVRAWQTVSSNRRQGNV